MHQEPLILIEQPKKVFETDEILREWSLPPNNGDVRVAAEKRSLDQVTARFHFVVPELMPGHGVLPILTVCRDSCVVLHMIYDQAGERIDVRMNAGDLDSELMCVTLPGVAPELICGRILSCSMERSLGKAVVCVYDPLEADEFSLTSVGASHALPGKAWGESPSGTWRVEIGSRGVDGESCSPLPLGFGLSGLQVSLESDTEDLPPIAYRGALDHLRSPLWSNLSWKDVNDEKTPEDKTFNDDWDFGDGEPIEEVLFNLAAQIEELSGGSTEWAKRAQALSDEARELALSVPEEAPVFTEDPDFDNFDPESDDDDIVA